MFIHVYFRIAGQLSQKLFAKSTNITKTNHDINHIYKNTANNTIFMFLNIHVKLGQECKHIFLYKSLAINCAFYLGSGSLGTRFLGVTPQFIDIYILKIL